MSARMFVVAWRMRTSDSPSVNRSPSGTSPRFQWFVAVLTTTAPARGDVAGGLRRRRPVGVVGAVGLDEVSLDRGAGERLESGRLQAVGDPGVPFPAHEPGADRGARARAQRVEPGQPPDAVLALRRAHDEREVVREVVADVHRAEQRVLRAVRPAGPAPRPGRSRASRIRRVPLLARLVIEHQPPGETDLLEDGVRTGEEQMPPRVARALQRRAHVLRVVLVVRAGDEPAVVEQAPAVRLEVAHRRVGEVVAGLLEPVHGRVVAARVPVRLVLSRGSSARTGG